MLYDVFISHASKDQEEVSKIVAYLEQAGYVCFVSYRDIPHCEDWADRLIEALEQSKCVIYVHTKAANNSNQIIREIQISVDDLKKPFIIYRLTDEPFKGGKKYFLQTLNWIDSLESSEQSLPLLVKTIRSTLNRKNNTIKKRPVLSSYDKTRPNNAVERKENKKKAITVFSTVIFVIFLICGVFILREKQAERLIKDQKRYDEYVEKAKEEMFGSDDVEMVFNHLDSAKIIASKYNRTKHKERFSVDLEQLENTYKSELVKNLDPLNEQIVQWYEIYDLLPEVEVKSNILSSIKKIQTIDSILGRKDADTILVIKKRLIQ